MRRANHFLLIFFIATLWVVQAHSTDEGDLPPLIAHSEGLDPQNNRFQSTLAIVPSSGDLDAVPPFLEEYENRRGPKLLVVSTDDPSSPVLEELSPFLKPYNDSPHFLLVEEGSGPTALEKMGHLIKENRAGIIMATLASVNGSIFYIAFRKLLRG